MRYWPMAPVVVLRTLARIVVLCGHRGAEMTASLASVTVPPIEPLDVCAKPEPVKSARTKAPAATIPSSLSHSHAIHSISPGSVQQYGSRSLRLMPDIANPAAGALLTRVDLMQQVEIYQPLVFHGD